MTITELIAQLEALRAQYGDLKVVRESSMYEGCNDLRGTHMREVYEREPGSPSQYWSVNVIKNDKENALFPVVQIF